MTKSEIEQIGAAVVAANVGAPDGVWHLNVGQTIDTPLGRLSVEGDRFSAIQLLLDGKLIKSLHPTRCWVDLPRWRGDTGHWEKVDTLSDTEHVLMPDAQ